MRRSTTGTCIVLFGLLAWLAIAWGDTLMVTASRANVRQGPGLTHGVMATLPRGATFPILSTQNGWHQIQLDDGRRAWIADSVVQLVRALERRPEAASQRRSALVIGNAAYVDARLRNPVNDATDVAATLRQLGFEVELLRDASRRQMQDAVRAFGSRLAQGGAGLFYYAGHGLQVAGQNYLVPIGANIKAEFDVEHEAVSAGWILGAMEYAGNGLNVVILDACRNNPYSRRFRGAPGLAALASPSAKGALIAYATSPGSVAADGAGRNGLYTKHLLRYLQAPGLSVEEMFKKVRIAVAQESGGEQTPWELSSLTGDFSFTVASTVGPGGSGDAERLQDAPRPDTPPPSPQANLEAAEAGLGLSRADRRLIQLGLLAEGFDVGKADGLIGKRARAALRQWQASRGEAATGYLDVAAAKALLASGEAQEAQEQEEARQAAAEAERRRREREPGTVFRDCAGCPEMVVVPAGSYMMGSPSGEAGRYDNQGPQHRVAIGEAFAVGVHEVTRGEFARFVRATGHSTGDSCWFWDIGKAEWAKRSGATWRNPGFEQTDRHPVVCVSWEDAQAYVRWLSRETGKGYRLLSESEWEYVARGGTRTARYWGESESGQCRHANGADLTVQRRHEGWTVASCDDGYYQTAPVGLFSPNGFGLYDVLGNAYEWVQDCWNASYKGAPGDGRAWKQGNCSLRVARGGSWYVIPRDLRAAFRFRNTTGNRLDNLGFRIARTLTP